MNTPAPLWLELGHGFTAGVGPEVRGRRGFFVLTRQVDNSRLRTTVAAGHIEHGRVTITKGALSMRVLGALEKAVREAI